VPLAVRHGQIKLLDQHAARVGVVDRHHASSAIRGHFQKPVMK
jgi:hypothetical protein